MTETDAIIDDDTVDESHLGRIGRNLGGGSYHLSNGIISSNPPIYVKSSSFRKYSEDNSYLGQSIREDDEVLDEDVDDGQHSGVNSISAIRAF